MLKIFSMNYLKIILYKKFMHMKNVEIIGLFKEINLFNIGVKIIMLS